MSGLAGGGLLMMVVCLIALLVIVLWVFMPFAIFGTKDVLRSLLAEQKQTNVKLHQLWLQNQALLEAGQQPQRPQLPQQQL